MIFHICTFVLHFGRIASLIYLIGIEARRTFFASSSPAFFIAGSTIGNNYNGLERTFCIFTMPLRLCLGTS